GCGIDTRNFTVTVNDTEKPTLTCPADVTTNTDAGQCYATGIALGTPTTFDNCGGTMTVTNDAPAQFPIGATSVVWTATDSYGNSVTCTQQVVVVDTRPLPLFCIISIAREGDNIRVTWAAAGGST